MKHLFIDIEWHHVMEEDKKSINEVLQIGYISLKSYHAKEKKYYAITKSKDIDKVNQSTLDFMHISREELRGGMQLEDVLDEVLNEMNTGSVIVIWNREAYDVFLESLKDKNKNIPKHNVVILQEVIANITKQRLFRPKGFNTELRRFDIKFDEDRLHCAMDDVNYLWKLYWAAERKYRKKSRAVNDTFSLPNSKVIHKDGCRYLRGKDKDKLKFRSENMIFKGDTFCKCCLAEKRFTRLSKSDIHFIPEQGMGVSEEKIKKICKENNMRCEITDNVIFIKTSISSWRILLDGRDIKKVFHENFRSKKSNVGKQMKINEGYHLQKVNCTDIYSTIEYIKNHEKKVTQNRYKKSRMERLFEKIENERKNKERT